MSAAQRIVTLTTDFGLGSRYVAAMKGVLLSINRSLTLVDISHAVPPQDVQYGGRVLAETVPWFPPGTIHVAVVDPGVGSKRRILCVEIAEQYLIAPDNGLLSCLAAEHPPTTMWAVAESQYWLTDEPSQTFHGRDIMAPVAARLSLGLAPERLGPLTAQMITLPQPRAARVGQQIEGEVIEVDSFGNLITNITSDMLDGAPRNETVCVRCGGHETYGLFGAYADQPSMTLIALVGSSDRLELAIVDDSAHCMLGLGAGAPVTVQW